MQRATATAPRRCGVGAMPSGLRQVYDMVPTKSRNVRGRRMRARTQCPATCHACGQERGQVSRGVETIRGAAGPPFSWGSAAPSRAIACPPPRARQSILRLTGVCLCACAGSGRASPEQGLLARGEPALQPLRRGRGVPRTCTQAEAGPAERQRGLPCGPGSPRPWHRRLRRLRCVKRPRAARPASRARACGLARVRVPSLAPAGSPRAAVCSARAVYIYI